MTPLEKLNALQAGELDKVLEGTLYVDEEGFFERGTLSEEGPNLAAKVEVTKAWMPEIIGAIDALIAADERGQGVGYAEAMNRLHKMLPELKKLKESL
jgi:hypothetical protein